MEMESGASQCIQVVDQGQDQGQGQGQALQAAVTTPPAGRVLKVTRAGSMSKASTARPVDNLEEGGAQPGDPSPNMQTVQDTQPWMPVALAGVVPAEWQLTQTSSFEVAGKEELLTKSQGSLSCTVLVVPERIVFFFFVFRCCF